MVIVRQFKKSSIGATDVTVVPDTGVGTGEGHSLPEDLPISQIVFSTNSATPPAEFWGTAAGDGVKYRVTIEQITG